MSFFTMLSLSVAAPGRQGCVPGDAVNRAKGQVCQTPGSGPNPAALRGIPPGRVGHPAGHERAGDGGRGLACAAVTRWIDLAHDLFVLAGVLAFAMSGALQAVGKRMDVVGICSLGIVTAVGGGILRDLLIGSTPPAALTDWTLVPVALAGSLVVFWSHGRWRLPRRPMLVLDALGLGLFCVEGTVKALGFGLNPYAAAVVGMLTGVGGGVLRDVLAGEIPSVFRHGSRLYVIPALAGGGVTAAIWTAGLYSLLALLAVAAAVSAIRIASLRLGWRAASPRALDEDPPPQ